MPCLIGRRVLTSTDVAHVLTERGSQITVAQEPEVGEEATWKRNCSYEQLGGGFPSVPAARCPSRPSLARTRTADLVGNFAPAPELEREDVDKGKPRRAWLEKKPHTASRTQ